MAQEIKDLIEKIQQEGLRIAEEKAEKIKSGAESEAQKIIAQARAQAEKIVEQANIETKRMQEAARASLKQSGRDLLISLRKEISSMLDKLIKADLRQALDPKELAAIIHALVKNTPLSLGSEIIVTLKQEDKEKLEKQFLSELVQETKKKVTLKSSDSVNGGFVISFDAGRSVFDFSSDSLAEYLANVLRPELAKFIKNE